jgi:hypothetical protein
MNLIELLSEKKQTILKKWFDAILNTYPDDTAKFLKKQKDLFANPVGNTFYNSMQAILDELLNKADADKLSALLDDIIKIRAIQDFAPSQSLAFIPVLKIVVREELGEKIRAEQFSGELAAFDHKVDNLLLLSFDVYMNCREKIYEIKASELRNMTSKLLERANRIFDKHAQRSEVESELEDILSGSNKDKEVSR